VSEQGGSSVARGATWPAPATGLVLRLAAWLLRRHSRLGRWQPVRGEDALTWVQNARSEERLRRQVSGEHPSVHLTQEDGVCQTRGHFHV
jgi:hypothetical protein